MLSLMILTLAVGSVVGEAFRPDYTGLTGRYCERRGTVRGNCCPSRLDDCSRPIRDTLCYCDEFCRETAGDCCPDYYTFCLGETPPDPVASPCYLRGQAILPGNNITDNCNLCKCEQVGPTQAELMCEMQKCLVQRELIQDINSNSNAYGWTASNYSQFWGEKLNAGLQYLLGTRYPDKLINQMYPITKVFDPRQLPRSFDARTKREWFGLISPVQDQGWCGASWAFSTATTAADRVAIQNPGQQVVHLSEQNVIDCGYLRRDGCQGGNLDRAWNYLRRYGVAQAECYPYESGVTQAKGSCKTPPRSRRPHELTCTNGTRVSLGHRDLIGMQPPYRIASKEHDIMHEIYHSGPVQAIMQVHEDFFSYRSGVYRQTRLRASSRTAYHSVRILGWGEEIGYRGQQVKYWLVANSWGRQWGEDGLFKIVRGENEADIETFVVGAGAKPLRGGRRYRGYRNYRRSRRHHLHSERARAKRHHTAKV